MEVSVELILIYKHQTIINDIYHSINHHMNYPIVLQYLVKLSIS